LFKAFLAAAVAHQEEQQQAADSLAEQVNEMEL
jgi:hypothetical protein